MRARPYGAAICSAAVMALALVSPALAQMPPDLAACACLRRAIDALGADWSARQAAYDRTRSDLDRLDGQLQAARGGLDVNNPEAVARFRQLLEQRDLAFRRSTEMASGELGAIIGRYNARVGEYNANCANRPLDPELMNQAAARCPPTY